MNARILALACVALAALAPRARAAAGVNVKGWTSDRMFVYQLDPLTEGTSTPVEFKSLDGETTAFVPATQGELYQKFLAAHPVREQPRSSRVAPGGKASVQLQLSPAGNGEWSGSSFRWSFPEREPPEFYGGPVPPDGRAMVFVVRPGASPTFIGEFSFYSAGGTLTPYWSRDGRALAWVVSPDEAPQPSVELFAAFGPAIELLADPTLARWPASITGRSGLVRQARLDEKMAVTLLAQGFNVVRVGKAQKARVKSVVYTAKPFLAKAKKLAQALPGGATVEPLTWKTPCDIVIALGTSSLAPNVGNPGNRGNDGSRGQRERAAETEVIAPEGDDSSPP